MAHSATHSEIITARAARRLPLRQYFDFIRSFTLPYTKTRGRTLRKWNCTPECNGSVAAGEWLGGVRPSSGAAVLESNGDVMKSGASGNSVHAAPGDGRSPPASPPPSLRDYAFMAKSFEPVQARAGTRTPRRCFSRREVVGGTGRT